MPIYGDESGGLGAGAMCFAAVSIDADAARAVVDRFRAVTGLRGELKGSRIGLIERAYVLELLVKAGGRAWISIAKRKDLQPLLAGGKLDDLALYGALIDNAVGHWLPETGGGCLDVVIDDGRYDARILGRVRADIQASLGGWGRASLADSDRSDGIQIADVVANCFFNMAVGSPRAGRIGAIIAPFLADKTLRTDAVTQV